MVVQSSLSAQPREQLLKELGGKLFISRPSRTVGGLPACDFKPELGSYLLTRTR